MAPVCNFSLREEGARFDQIGRSWSPDCRELSSATEPRHIRPHLCNEKHQHGCWKNDTSNKMEQRVRKLKMKCSEVKNKDGEFQYFYGSDEKRAAGQPRSFFLEPYAEIVKLCWSKGRRRETRNLFIERFDCRAQFMSFEFNCRTSDNVELILEGTFFWEVVDLPAMVKSTGDTSGDLCNHARSQFIRHVARVTLKEFMDSSHAIAKKVWEEDTSFYASRGVKIHSLEVTRYQCADSRTSEILEQIIQDCWLTDSLTHSLTDSLTLSLSLSFCAVESKHRHRRFGCAWAILRRQPTGWIDFLRPKVRTRWDELDKSQMSYGTRPNDHWKYWNLASFDIV